MERMLGRFKLSKHLLRRLIFDGLNFSTVAGIIIYGAFAETTTSLPDLRSTLLYFMVIFGLGIGLSIAVNKKGRRTLGEVLFSSPESTAGATDHSVFRSLWGAQLLVSFIILLLAAGFQTEFSLTELLNQEGMTSALSLFRELSSPDWSLLPVAIVKVVETIFIAFLATVFALPIAFVLSFFAAKNLMQGSTAFGAYGVLRTLLNVVRSVEPIIWAIIFAVWVGVGPFAGMLALMVQSIASLTKQYSEIIEGISDGPIEGILSTGANPIQTVWFGVVPQVILPFISFTIYRWDINVRMATIIGFAGGGGIGTILYQYSMRSQWNQVGCLILVIAFVVWVLDILSAYIREALK